MKYLEQLFFPFAIITQKLKLRNLFSRSDEIHSSTNTITNETKYGRYSNNIYIYVRNHSKRYPSTESVFDCTFTRARLTWRTLHNTFSMIRYIVHLFSKQNRRNDFHGNFTARVFYRAQSETLHFRFCHRFRRLKTRRNTRRRPKQRPTHGCDLLRKVFIIINIIIPLGPTNWFGQ